MNARVRGAVPDTTGAPIADATFLSLRRVLAGSLASSAALDAVKRVLRRLLLIPAAAWVMPFRLVAQESSIVTGHVTDASGAPLIGAQVSIPSLGVSGSTRRDGSYTIVVPLARARTAPVTVTARLIGYNLDSMQVTLAAGSMTADFALADNPFHLGEVVVTGAGTAAEAEKLGTVRNSIDSTSIRRANEQNLVTALAAKAPGVTVTSASGDPGASSYIQLRGITTLEASDGQPLFVVDGVPVDNSTQFTSNGGPLLPNRVLDINPDDIANIEILKGAAAGAIYGSRAGQGVVLITTKKARPGQTTVSLRSSWSLSQHTQLPALQTEYGLGGGGIPDPCVPSSDPGLLNCDVGSTRSYGPWLPPGTPVYNHQDEMFRTGYMTDNTLSASGASDRAQFFLSGGYSYNRGIVVGDNNHYRRISLRFNGSHQVTEKLKLGASVAYANGLGGFVVTRNSVGSVLLGGWRTPPEFNNLPYLDPVFGLHRSYRFPNPGPGSEQASRGYNNPFFTANESPTTSGVSRTFGAIDAEWAPTSWLKLHETIGLDYSNDEQFAGLPWSSSEAIGVGAVIAGYVRNQQIDHNLTATLTYRASSAWSGTITLGQNLNSQGYRHREMTGFRLLAPQPFNLANTAETAGTIDFEQNLHLESYFGQVTADLGGRVFVTAALRNDGASSFGADSRRHWFPKASGAWVFRGQRRDRTGLVTYGKLRTAYGQSGTQPKPYLLSSRFTGIGQVAGVGALTSGSNLPNARLGPERVKEFEAGFDIGLLGDKADLSVSHYRESSTGVILSVPVSTSSGYLTELANAATLQNRGWEVSLAVRPVVTRSFAWNLELQWARNRGITRMLPPGIEFAPLPYLGGTDGAGNVQGSAIVGQPIGVYFGTDYVRCGRGVILDEIDIDHTSGQCQGAATGALYIEADGQPVIDNDNQYALGDPNPAWTGSVRTDVRVGRVSIGGLLDIRHGGVAFNGTQGALNEFGTGLNTAQGRDGAPVVFGRDYYPGLYPTAVAGPGVGVPFKLDENWFRGNASVFSGIGSLFLENGGWVKLREVSVGYMFDQPWVSHALGFRSIELRVAARNLVSWNSYSGVDPETTILGAVSPVPGINYYNNPQTRSWVFTLALNR
jgi:TonB-linked SusC/RagA family outer membrane protein